ncbi:MAG TPA: glutamine synthetase family protein [Acidimicrobiales bacterium]|nr:glutamine synthetase family protein [Acidimicrobiales bacterium]
MIDIEGLRWVRLVFVDTFGALHAVVLPASRFPVAVEEGVSFDGSAVEGRARHFEEDMLLKPDPATLIRLDDEQGRVVCTVVGADGRPWLGDPRTALVTQLANLDDLAARYRAAAEIEFYVLHPDGRPADRGGYFGATEGPGMAVTKKAAERLMGYSVEVIGTHLEAGPGQYEIDLASLPPLALADAIFLTKKLLRDEAGRAGLRVTFMARPLAGEPGSGLHLHQHLVDDPAAGAALFDGRGRLAPAGQAFVGGQLAHAAGLAALACPNVNSFKRLHSGPEAPSDVIWGHLNRAAVLRVGTSGEQRPAVEFRLADPAANAYLLVGGLLAAAEHGMSATLDPGSPSEEDIGGYDAATTEAVPVRALPRDIDSALDALLADDVLVDTFDSRLLSRLVDGRRAEAEDFRSQVTRWEIDRYLDEA